MDNTAPTAAITYDSTGPYKSGETVIMTATFNKEVVDSPIPQIAITGSGIANVSATNMTKSSSTVYTYSYSVPTGNGSGTISLSNGTDAAGNAITSTPTSGATFTVDNTSPTAAITYDSTGPYKNGETVVITATFNEAMADSPVPQITITGSGIATVSATNMTKSSSTVYTYSYNVPSGNGSGTISLSNGTDAAGNVITSTPTSGATFNVDNFVPTAAITYDSTGPYKQGDTVVMTATFNEAVLDLSLIHI